MKKIQKEIVRKEYVSVFVANDGTEFSDEAECKKYDESAKGVLLAKYQQVVLKESDAYSLFGFGSDEEVIEVVKLNSKEDVDLIVQCYLLENDYIKEREDYNERMEKMITRLKKSVTENDIIFIGRGYDKDGFYFEGTRNEHIDVLRRLGEPVEKSE